MTFAQTRGQWVPETLELVPARDYDALISWGSKSSWNTGSPYKGHMDMAGVLHVAEGSTAEELAELFVSQAIDDADAGRIHALTLHALAFALNLIPDQADETTRGFWDAVRERLTANATKEEE